MRLSYLGHAMWLAELSELRILFDPLIEGTHHGGVFEIFPPRKLDIERLEADFIVVSHRHPDHFDVASLAALARVDADSVVLTSDPLVADVSRKLGFRSVTELQAFDRVTLASGELLTTPSRGVDVEWGMLLLGDGVSVWNQVDTVFRGATDITETLSRAAELLERSIAPLDVDLALVRWQPLLEVEAMLGHRVGFPLASYGDLLDQVAAIDAKALIPSSAGSRHASTHAFMNRLVYPVSEERFLADIAARTPHTKRLPARMGTRYEVTTEGTFVGDAIAGLVTVDPSGLDDRVFRPFEIPPVTDSNASRSEELAALALAERWVKTELLTALEREYDGFGTSTELSLVLEIVGPTTTEAHTIRVGPSGALHERRMDDDYDVLNVIAASSLREVLEGRQHWGQPLLAGRLRSSVRAYAVSDTHVTPLRIAPLFVYYALSYDESVVRSTAHLVTEVAG